MQIILPVLLSIILSSTYIIGYKYFSSREKYHISLMSLGSGILISLIFIELIPEIFVNGIIHSSIEILSIGMLFGFVCYHLIERYTYKHVYYKHPHERRRIKEDIGHLHVGGFIVEKFLKGFILVLVSSIYSEQIYVLLLFFSVFLIDDIASSINFRHITEKFKLRDIESLFLSFSMVLGAVVGAVVGLSIDGFYVILSILSGVFIYFVIRDELPKGRNSNPKMFIIGVVLVVVIFSIAKGFV